MSVTNEGIDRNRERCEGSRDILRDLARIHLAIDAPKRCIGVDDPDWIFRLRKLCLHVVAISKWEVSVDNVHAMATDLRAAYVQMDVIWNRLPGEYSLDEIDANWWIKEARTGVLAKFDHPTPLSLGFPLVVGGFGETENPKSFLQFAVLLGELGIGYGLALSYLAKVLESDENISSRVAAVMESLRES